MQLDLVDTGYHVLRKKIPVELIEKLQDKFDLLVPHRAHGLSHKYYPQDRIHECRDLGIWWSQQVTDWPEVVDISKVLVSLVGYLFDEPRVYVADIITNEPGNTFVKPHIDSPYRFDRWWASKELLGIQCIVPLCKFTVANGGTGIMPGSHKRDWVVKDCYAGVHNKEFLENVVQPEMSMGDVLVYNPRMLHSTMPNLTQESRRALLIHITTQDMIEQMQRVDNIWLNESK